MYRGSIPPIIPLFHPLFCWRCCAPLYIAKLQDKALCRLNTRLQKEFTWENIKLKIFGKSVVRAWRNRGFKGISQCELLMMRSAIFSHHELIHLAKWQNFAPWRKSPCEIFAMWNSPCEIGHLAWCSCLPKAISSSFQLQIIHGLKRWILDFLSFQMVYSMQKMDFGKCSKSSKEDCSYFLHSVFFTLFSSSPLLVLVFPLEIQAYKRTKSLLNSPK